MKLVFSRHTFENYSNIKIHENRVVGAELFRTDRQTDRRADGQTDRQTDVTELSVTSGFRRDVDEICALLGCYAASSGNPLRTFRDKVSVPSSRVKQSNEAGCPETSVKDYHSTLRNTLEERRSDDETGSPFSQFCKRA
jgi:hypothetical protein